MPLLFYLETSEAAVEIFLLPFVSVVSLVPCLVESILFVPYVDNIDIDI